jgi:hypothetical protein
VSDWWLAQERNDGDGVVVAHVVKGHEHARRGSPIRSHGPSHHSGHLSIAETRSQVCHT